MRWIVCKDSATEYSATEGQGVKYIVGRRLYYLSTKLITALEALIVSKTCLIHVPPPHAKRWSTNFFATFKVRDLQSGKLIWYVNISWKVLSPLVFFNN